MAASPSARPKRSDACRSSKTEPALPAGDARCHAVVVGGPEAAGGGIGNVLGSTARVRRAERRDADAIGEAHGEAWRVGYANLFSVSALTASVTERRTRWTGLLAEGHLEGDLIVR